MWARAPCGVACGNRGRVLAPARRGIGHTSNAGCVVRARALPCCLEVDASTRTSTAGQCWVTQLLIRAEKRWRGVCAVSYGPGGKVVLPVAPWGIAQWGSLCGKQHECASPGSGAEREIYAGQNVARGSSTGSYIHHQHPPPQYLVCRTIDTHMLSMCVRLGCLATIALSTSNTLDSAARWLA